MGLGHRHLCCHGLTGRGWFVVPAGTLSGGVSRRTFYRWRELGVGPECLKIPNGELRAWRRDFLAWLEDLRDGAA